MRLLRLLVLILAVTLVASACGGGDNEASEDEETTVTTTVSLAATRDTGTVTTPTAQEPPDPTAEGIDLDPVPVTPPTDPPVTIEPPEEQPAPGAAAPPETPLNPQCTPGVSEGELIVEFDALTDPANVSKMRVYVSEDGGPFIVNGEFTVDEADTSRSGGTRWALPARRLPLDVPLRFTVTSFNLLEQESPWYRTSGTYTGQGQACDGSGAVETPTTTTDPDSETELPPPTPTAG